MADLNDYRYGECKTCEKHIDEIARLRAENERLQRKYEDNGCATCDEVIAERNTIRARVERLEGALRKYKDIPDEDGEWGALHALEGE